MQSLAGLLAQAVPAGFVAIGLASVAHWLRRRDASSRWMAVALGCLGLAGLFQMVVLYAPAVGRVRALYVVDGAVFAASGYALFELRCALMPYRPPLRGALLGATIGATTLIGVVVAGGRSSGGLAVLQVGAALLYVAVWCVCVGEPIYRFWHASGSRPAVQRARLRALSLGYFGIVLVLLLSVVSSVVAAAQHASHQPPVVGALLQLISMACIPLLYVSFAPPSWLRRSWRGREQQSLRAANRELMMFSPDAHSLASPALLWALRLMGADAGLVADSTGEILAATGMDMAEAEQILWESRDGASQVALAGGITRIIQRTPLQLGTGDGALIMVAGPLTPVFGSGENATLEEYAGSLAIAMDRVRAMESLAEKTRYLGEQIRENQSLLGAISTMGEGVLVTEDNRFVSANRAFEEMLGYSVDELRAMSSLSVLIPEDLRAELIERTQLRTAGEEVPSRYDSRMVRKDGSIVDVEMGIALLSESRPPRTMAIVRDIAERKEYERRLIQMGRTDSLTGVANRHAWEESLAGAMARARRDARPLTLAMLDMDRFKAFNDDWGHQRGDDLLVQLASAWKAELREVDVLVRYGGDEFAALLPGADEAAARTAMERLSSRIPERQSASIGIATWDGTESAQGFLGRADAALYAAKRAGGACVRAAAPARPQQPALSWEAQLTSLLRDGAFDSVYQPIVSLADRSVIGYEALARPVGVSADTSVEELFAAAHAMGFSRDLDWLGRKAAVQGAHALPGGQLLFVNVGLWSLLDPLHDVDQMLLLLRWAGRDPASVVLEMSEREVVSDIGRLREVLEAYRAEGFTFALDDVGEGHSTFEVLAAADAEFIKVARGLTVRAAEPGAGSAIRALAAFAASTGARIVAEGIENEAMGQQMRELGVELGQGYGLGRPAGLPVKHNVHRGTEQRTG